MPEVNQFQTSEDFLEGRVLIIDKPLEWTSFDVVNKVRWMIRNKFDIKKIKVGHAGTLDPLATGVLVICTGRMTKRINELMGQDKVYTGSLLLGKTTPSYDAETEVDAEFAVDHIGEEDMVKAAKSFEGEIEQTPPVYSAKKVDGKKAYVQARKGKEIKMRSAFVRIDRFELQTADFPSINFEVACSKGTYIRSLAYDFGKALNSGAYLTSLCRTRSGDFAIEHALSLKTLEAKMDALATR